MTTARFFLGASLFALLIMDICCVPVKKGFKKAAAAAAAAPVSSQFLPADEEEMSTVESSSVQYLSPPRPPPPPPGSAFKAGELSHYENSYEHADYERETEDQGYLPPPPPPSPMKKSSAPQLTSQPRPLPGHWIFYPYDHMFLTRQYLPGTLTHSSVSFEQGRDHWQDSHYVRPYHADNPDPVEQTEPEAPESLEDPPVKTVSGYGQPAVSQGSADDQAGHYFSGGVY
ncbi:hypothetical protein JOB18_008599 [Solea senegalensis]|uniref:Uncharacterized protein n=1 Tax=Solea senegalensis TaxID=28829 RepID=A0AAV6SL91_SOLSE|nr:uncharacterized protein LOC122778460 [Solea senegalensis]KAG7517463.1 hypothetical protein JOB18_008599 [Solea senegalensis]